MSTARSRCRAQLSSAPRPRTLALSRVASNWSTEGEAKDVGSFSALFGQQQQVIDLPLARRHFHRSARPIHAKAALGRPVAGRPAGQGARPLERSQRHRQTRLMDGQPPRSLSPAERFSSSREQFNSSFWPARSLCQPASEAEQADRIPIVLFSLASTLRASSLTRLEYQICSPHQLNSAT